MPIYNITIDDVSPVILYNGVWGDSSHTDPEWENYLNGTFHPTQQPNATATLSFRGSAIYLFGAFRSNHDIYTVILDASSASYNGYSSVSKFQQAMFGASGLDSSQEHLITLQNTPRNNTLLYVDLDYIIVTEGDGNPNTQPSYTTLDDDDSSIQYSSGWDMAQQIDYFGSTLHQTNGANNYATVTFRGNAIDVYGGTAPDHGLFTVSLDNEPAQTFNGTAHVQRSKVLLYHASGLSNGQHEVIITNIDTNGKWLDIDSITLADWSGSNNTATVGPQSLPGPPLPTASASSTAGHVVATSNATAQLHKIAVGPLIGGLLGGLVGLAFVIVAIVFFLRNRSNRRIQQEAKPFGLTGRPWESESHNVLNAGTREAVVTQSLASSGVLRSHSTYAVQSESCSNLQGADTELPEYEEATRPTPSLARSYAKLRLR